MSAMLPPAHRVAIKHKKVTLDSQILEQHEAALIVCTAVEVERTLESLPYGARLKQLHARAQAGGPVQIIRLSLPGKGSGVLAVGVLKPESTMFERLSLAGRLWKEVCSPAPRRVALSAVGFDAETAALVVEALTAATLAGAAPIPKFKSKADQPPPLESITVVQAEAKPELDACVATHEGNHLARWLTSLPPNHLNCAGYRKALRKLAQRHDWQYQFFNVAALRRLGAGAFLAVARANPHQDAGIAKLSYRSTQKSRGRIALVGKGVCFDTGGINLKSHKSMYDMHTDMQGSAVAVGALLALSKLKAPYDIDCWLALTENEIGPNAYRPQEVVTAVNGVTIQVVHSDAEGRMALADTLALAARDTPNVILDFATLTGACVSALTERMSGAFSNRRDWHELIAQAGQRSGERVWNFPMDADFDSDLDSSIADVMQCTMDNKGDHILAARFLQRFVPENVPWIHIDLSAGNRSGGLAHIPTEVTGFGVRFATELLLQQPLFVPMASR